MDIKQVIIVPADLKMSPGKLAAQVAHAAVGAYKMARSMDRSFPAVQSWEEHGVTKIVLRVPSHGDLLPLIAKAQAAKLPWALITDEGRTEIAPGSVTALAIGPGEIDSITGHLPLY